MDNQTLKLGYEIFFIQFFHVFGIVFSVALNFMIWLKSRKTKAVGRFMLLQGLFVLWMIAKVLKTVSFNVDLRWSFIVLQYLGVCFIGSVFLMFAIAHVHEKPLGTKQELLLNLFPGIVFLLVLTNPWHYLFYSSYDFAGDTFGPVFYVLMFFTYSCILVGIWIILSHGQKSSIGVSPNSKVVDYLLGLGILIPLLFNVLYLTKTYKLIFGVRPLFDYTPICYSIALGVFGFAVFGLDLFGAVKAAALETFDSLSQPVAILSDEGRLHLANNAYSKHIPEDWCNHQSGVADYSGQTFRIRGPNSTCHYVGSLLTMGTMPFRIRYRVINMVDITERVDLAEAVGNKNVDLEYANKQLERHNANLEELAVKRERIRAARNLHDILGHTLVLVISVLESAAMQFSRNERVQGMERVDAAGAIAKQGREELNRSLALHASGHKDLGFLEDRIRAIGEQVSYSGVGFEMSAEHNRELINSEKTETALRAVQEATTNAVRHGKAQSIELYLRVISACLVVIIKDDGNGSLAYSEGFGLSQMRHKLEALEGKLNCSTEPGMGYTLQFSLPL